MCFGLGDTLSAAGGAGEAIITAAQWPTLMLTYGIGFLGIFLLFAVMNLRAYRRREELGLDQTEVLVTLATIRSHLISAGFGLASIALVLVNRGWFEWAGVIYMFIGPVQGLHGWWSGRGIERSAVE